MTPSISEIREIWKNIKNNKRPGIDIIKEIKELL